MLIASPEPAPVRLMSTHWLVPVELDTSWMPYPALAASSSSIWMAPEPVTCDASRNRTIGWLMSALTSNCMADAVSTPPRVCR